MISKKVGWREIAGEIVAYDCATHNMFVWNDSASLVWKCFAAGMSLERTAKAVCREYRVDLARAREDAKEFLEQLQGLGLADGIASKEPLDSSRHPVSSPDGEKVLLYIEMRAIEAVVPFSVTFEVTNACNEDCIHCFMDKGLRSMDTVSIKRVLGELSRAGCLFVSFTGGEFFCRRDALEILKHASDLRFAIDVLSNGTLITKKIAAYLATISLRRVQVSLYGACDSVHDAVTRRPGSFKSTISSIVGLREHGIKVEIAFPMMNHNFHARHEMKELAQSLGCEISMNHIITARNNGSCDTLRLRISDKDMSSFLNDSELFGYYAGRKPFADHQLYFGFKDIRQAPPCFSGINSCAITPQGKVLPCNQLLYEVGDLRRQSFAEIWSGSRRLRKLRRIRIKDLAKCVSCELLPKCTRCPGLALLEGGGLLGHSPENCRVSRLSP